jgi:polysaccharide biosynthesis protein PslH
MFRVLYTTPIVAHPPMGGPEMDVENAIKALSTISELHIISRMPRELSGGSSVEQFFGAKSAAFHYSPSAQSNIHAKVRRRVRAWLGQNSVHADVDWILSYYRKHSLDVIWCDRGEESSVELIHGLKAKDPSAKVVCDTCAVYSQFILRGLPYATSDEQKQQILAFGKKKEEQEKSLVNIADVTTAVSETDAEYYRSIARAPESVMLFSNMVDVDVYQRVEPPPGFVKPALLCPGSYYSPESPMADGAHWFVNDVLPLIREQVPSVNLYLAGKGSDRNLGPLVERADPHVIVTGRVPSMLPFLTNADVCIVPLRFESGTRFKILEAGASGTPVVSTTLGAEGLPVESGRHLLIADTPEGFAEAIVRVIRNRTLAATLSRELNLLVKSRFGIDRLAAEGAAVLGYLKQ